MSNRPFTGRFDRRAPYDRQRTESFAEGRADLDDARFRDRYSGSPFPSTPNRPNFDQRYPEPDWQRTRDRHWQGPSRQYPRLEDRPPVREFYRREEVFRSYPHPPRDYNSHRIPNQREYFHPRARSPPRRVMDSSWTPDFHRDVKHQPRSLMSNLNSMHSSSPSLMSSMENQKQRRLMSNMKGQSTNVRNTFLLSKPSALSDKERNENIGESNDAYSPKPVMNSKSLLQSKNENLEPEIDEQSSDSEDDDDDGFNQDQIEKQIDHIDNEITKQERLLQSIQRKIAEDKNNLLNDGQLEVKMEDISTKETKQVLKEYILEGVVQPYRPNPVEPTSLDNLVHEIYAANRQLCRQYSIISCERNAILYNLGNHTLNSLPSCNPNLIDENNSINPKLRAYIVSYLQNRKRDALRHENHLVNEYQSKYKVWKLKLQEKEEKLVDKKIQNITPSLTQQHFAEERPRITRRNPGLRSDFVRSDAEYQQTIAMLGVVPEDENQKIQDRCAKEVVMITDPIKRKELFVNTNNRIIDPEMDLAIFNQSTINSWYDHERSIFKSKLSQFGKDFGKISSFVERKTVKDCVAFYYHNLHQLRFKSLLRRNRLPGRGRRRKEKVEVDSDCFKIYHLESDEDVIFLKTASVDSEEDIEIEDTQLSPGDVSPGSPAVSVEESDIMFIADEWNQGERLSILEAFEKFGHSYEEISSAVKTKTPLQCKNYLRNYHRQLDAGNRGIEIFFEKTKENLARDVNNKTGENEVAVSANENKRKQKRPNDDEQIEKRKTAKKPKKMNSLDLPAEESGIELSEERRQSTVNDADNEEEEEGAGTNPVTRRVISYWTPKEREDFLRGLSLYGRNWEAIASEVNSKSIVQVRNFFNNSRKKLELDKILDAVTERNNSGRATDANFTQKRASLTDSSPLKPPIAPILVTKDIPTLHSTISEEPIGPDFHIFNKPTAISPKISVKKNFFSTPIFTGDSDQSIMNVPFYEPANLPSKEPTLRSDLQSSFSGQIIDKPSTGINSDIVLPSLKNLISSPNVKHSVVEMDMPDPDAPVYKPGIPIASPRYPISISDQIPFEGDVLDAATSLLGVAAAKKHDNNLTPHTPPIVYEHERPKLILEPQSLLYEPEVLPKVKLELPNIPQQKVSPNRGNSTLTFNQTDLPMKYGPMPDIIANKVIEYGESTNENASTSVVTSNFVWTDSQNEKTGSFSDSYTHIDDAKSSRSEFTEMKANSDDTETIPVKNIQLSLPFPCEKSEIPDNGMVKGLDLLIDVNNMLVEAVPPPTEPLSNQNKAQDEAMESVGLTQPE
ncbi:nuclear receptor co-repressor 1 [Globomyces sp. JEL0801]|nr:nuclear receptor co-repressor 1 [Globomyces sp. JEL0801]